MENEIKQQRDKRMKTFFFIVGAVALIWLAIYYFKMIKQDLSE